MLWAFTRAMVTKPSSMGWRSASSTSRRYSGSSSRNSTPLWALLISPGRALGPPPTRLAWLAVWWGERKGRSVSSPVGGTMPATE